MEGLEDFKYFCKSSFSANLHAAFTTYEDALTWVEDNNVGSEIYSIVNRNGDTV